MRLRIITGSLGGRLIHAPNADTTRPTTGRVKETLFNLITNQIDFDGIRVLDIFAGSGQLGFEALSRGAEEIDFIDTDFTVIKNLERNITDLKVTGNCKIHKENATSFTSRKQRNGYDLILSDPPFFKYDVYDVVKNIFQNDLLTTEGIMVIERSIQTIQKDVEEFKFQPQKRIGDACLYFFSRET